MTTSTYTHTTTRTFTHTATHLAGVIASALAETLIAIGISVDKATRVYGYEAALSTWIAERSLERIRITTTSPGGTESPAYSVTIDYSTFDPDVELRDQLARLRRQLAKEPRVSVGSDFTVTSVPRPGFQLSDQIGWSSRSTPLPVFNDGYRHGTAGSGPGASAVFRSHRLG